MDWRWGGTRLRIVRRRELCGRNADVKRASQVSGCRLCISVELARRRAESKPELQIAHQLLALLAGVAKLRARADVHFVGAKHGPEMADLGEVERAVRL